MEVKPKIMALERQREINQRRKRRQERARAAKKEAIKNAASKKK